jgi:hypothetical protein
VRPSNSIDIVIEDASINLYADGAKGGTLASFDLADPDFDVLMLKNMIMVAYHTKVF